MKTIALKLLPLAVAVCVWAAVVPCPQVLFVFATLAALRLLFALFPDDDLPISLAVLAAFVLGFLFIGALVGWLTLLKVASLLVPLQFAVALLRRRLA